MARITLISTISLDGMFEGPDHDISWHAIDDEVHSHVNSLVAGRGAVLNGRRTWELMVPFWPQADSMPDATPATIEYAQIFRRTPQYVFSRTLTESEWAAGIFSEINPHEVQALADKHGSLGVGAGEVGGELLRLGLIDEIAFYIAPVVLGAGTRALPAELPLELALVESRQFGNGDVFVRYAVG